MGSRLHGNDGRRWAHPQSSFPRRRESAVGAGDGFPSARERRAAAGAPTTVIPAKAGIHGGGPAMGSRLHGNDGRRRRTHNRHSRDGGNPRRGAGDGFPSARERRAATGAPTIVIPATAGIRGGGRRWVPVCTGTTGGDRRTHNRHSRDGGNPRRGAGDGFPSPRERRAAAGAPTIVIPVTAGICGGGRRWVPVCTGTTGGDRRTHNRHSRDGGKIRGGGPAMGSRLHGNDGRRRAHPQPSFPRRRESTAGGRRWVPVCTGTTGGDRRTHNRHSRDGGNPRRGAGDGFPSPRERRASAGAPTPSFP